MSDLNVFASLPVYIQRKIDHAFDTIAGRRKSSAADHEVHITQDFEEPGGGFIVEGSGGFIDEQKPTQISMADVPSALQFLDLAPDDEQVIAVFRNAASGWTASSSKDVDVDDAGGGWVSREDWRSVCAVLLEHYQEEYQDDSDHDTLLHSDKEPDVASDDQYVESDSQDDDSGDDYVEGRSTRKNTRQNASKQKNVSGVGIHGLTERQQIASLEAFTLFFPDVPSETIPQQKILIKDIQRVATLLGEKIKADEVLEMVDAFSTSSDKSIGLADFSRIMVAAKLA